MKQIVVIAIFCLAIAYVADAVFGGGKNFDAVKQEAATAWSWVMRHAKNMASAVKLEATLANLPMMATRGH